MMDICIKSQIHLLKDPARPSLKHYLVWVSFCYLFFHGQKFLLEILKYVASELLLRIF